MAPPPQRSRFARILSYRASTTWPGFSRLAPIWSLLLLLVGLAHLILGFYIAHQLFNLPSTALCQVQDRQQPEALKFPLTIEDPSQPGRVPNFSIYERGSVVSITVGMLLWPLGIIAIVARNVFKHFRGTMSNWNGFLFTMLAIAIWALLPFIDHILSVDPTALITDFRVCVASDAQVLAKARNTRLVCFAVREWFVAAAAILLVVYLISCFGAMWLNNKNADTSASRTAALMEASDPGQIQREVVAEPERATPSSARGDDVELAVLRNGVEDVHGEGPERLERARV